MSLIDEQKLKSDGETVLCTAENVLLLQPIDLI